MVHQTVVLCTGIIRDKNSKILFLRRSGHNKNFQNVWQLPEGKIEFGESPEQALSREIKEELGLKIKNMSLNFISSKVVSLKGVKYQLLRIVYDAKVNPGKINLSKEHIGYRWVSRNDQCNPKIPGLLEILMKLNFYPI